MSEPLNEFQANEAFQNYLEGEGVVGTVPDTAAEEAAPDEAPVVEHTPAPEQPVAETAAAPDKPRDDKGRFVSPEDRLAEAQKLIARQGNELGELRKQFDEMTAAQQRALEPQAQQYDLSNVDEAIMQQPDPQFAQQIAAAALRQNDGIAYEKALRAWADFDQFGALRFEQQRSMWQLQSQMQELVQPAIQSTQQLSQQQAAAQAFQQAQQEYADLPEVISSIDLAQVPKAYLRAFEEDPSDPEAVKILYRYALTVNQSADQSAAQYAADQTAATELLKAQAAVATPSAPAAEGTGGEEWGNMPHPDEVHGWDEVTRLSPDFYKRLLTPPATSLQRTV